MKDSPAQTQRDNWDDGDIRLLYEIWSDDRVQSDLGGTDRNFTIYRRIAARFECCAGRGQGGGGQRDWEVRTEGRILLCTNKESVASDVSCLMLPL